MPTKTKASTRKLPAKKDAADQLEDFMIDAMKDMYWAEKNILKEIPKMIKNSTSAKLKDAIRNHQGETETQVKRLEEAFSSIGRKAQAAKCEAMDGLLKEAKSIMEETEPGAVRDAGIIAAIQKVEHYEIASYGTIATYADLLGHKEALRLFRESLAEEKKADTDLTKLAKKEINLKAV